MYALVHNQVDHYGYTFQPALTALEGFWRWPSCTYRRKLIHVYLPTLGRPDHAYSGCLEYLEHLNVLNILDS